MPTARRSASLSVSYWPTAKKYASTLARRRGKSGLKWGGLSTVVNLRPIVHRPRPLDPVASAFITITIKEDTDYGFDQTQRIGSRSGGSGNGRRTARICTTGCRKRSRQIL